MIVRVHHQPGERRAQTETGQDRPLDPEGELSAAETAHREESLHLRLVDAVEGEVDEDAADA